MHEENKSKPEGKKRSNETGECDLLLNLEKKQRENLKQNSRILSVYRFLVKKS
jgi:hypothetical protein